MTEKDGVDLDITSRSQVYRALRRAESDYGSFARRTNVSRQRKITENWLENERFRSRTAFTTARISRNDYARLVKDVRLIANKEIKSSVSRSRRWSGKEGGMFRKQPAAKLEPSSHLLNPRGNAFQVDAITKEIQHDACDSPENSYHKTVCDILTNKGATSSYGHVAKILKRKTNKKVRFESKLPEVFYLNELSRHEPQTHQKETSSSEPTRKQLDVTLPSVLRSDTTDGVARSQNSASSHLYPLPDSCELPAEAFFKPNTSKMELPPDSKPLRSSNIFRVLSDDAFASLHEREQERLMTSLKKKQAHRAIAGYYNKKRESYEEHPKMVIVHLPNPNASLETFHNRKRTPKLLLRNITRSSDNSSRESGSSISKQSTSDECPATTTLSRINIRPFVSNASLCKATHT